MNIGSDDVSVEQSEAIANLFLTKLLKQQKIMALHQNNENNPKSFEVNPQKIIYNSRNTPNVNNDRFWFDQNIDNVRNQSKQSANLSALKHDHPLIASAVDNIGSKANGLCSDESILIGSLPPTEPHNISQTGQWFDSNDYTFDRKSICLPFGYCYDDDKTLQNHNQMNINLNDIKTTFTDSQDWFNDCTDFRSNINPYYNGVTGYPYSGSDYDIENVFQVDKGDLKNGPTLAELNASDVWDALDLDDLLASAQIEGKYISNNRSRFGSNNYRSNVSSHTSAPTVECEYDSKLQENIDYLSSLLQSSKNSGNTVQSMSRSVVAETKPRLASSLSPNVSPTVPQEILQNSQNAVQPNPCPQKEAENKPIPNETRVVPSNTTVLSTLLGAQTVKQKTLEKSQHMPQTSTAQISQNKIISTITEEHKALTRVRNNSMSTEYSASSHDEGFASQPDDSDNDDEDMSSDDESFYGDYDAADLLGASTSDDANNKWSLNMGRSRKGGERRYFWQYNVQSKGPKGTRIVSIEKNDDPHVFSEISDPVFSPDCQIEGVKHSGKARRGDGNDLTPNPKKLLMIGLELKKLSKIINDLTPVAEVPVSSRGKSRKEKNKLASRACRLKKKAQHEANKIKLYGLQMEHKKIMYLLCEVKKLIHNYSQNTNTTEMSSIQTLERLIKARGPSVTVAGKTSEFVNHILDNVAAGISNGGLDKI